MPGSSAMWHQTLGFTPSICLFLSTPSWYSYYLSLSGRFLIELAAVAVAVAALPAAF